MTMRPGLRRFTFTTNITSSIGWFGAVIVFLALAIVGLTSKDEVMVRGAYLVMAPAAWFVLVPLAHASLLSGIALSLGTTWGLFQHYWVLLKLLITVFSTGILLIYMGTFRQMAGVAADPTAGLGLVRNPSPMVHAILALALLVVATVLAIYKPLGMTAYGIRKQLEQRQALTPAAVLHQTGAAGVAMTTPRSLSVFGIVALAAVLLFIILHLIGGGLAHH